MSCHYSCATCSSAYYFDLCLTCPTTRTLSAAVCSCSSGYYQAGQSRCITSLPSFDSILISTLSIAYYVAIGLHLLSIIFALNRLLSPFLKRALDTLQLVAIIGLYRWPQQALPAAALKTMAAFNFNYFDSLLCNEQTRPLGCDLFQNLIGPGLTIVLFFFLFFFGYLLALCLTPSSSPGVVYVGRKNSGDGVSLFIYLQSVGPSLLLLYLDQTAVQTSVAISRIAIVNYWGLLILAGFLLLVAVGIRLHFRTVNHPKQTTLAHRARSGLFYLYDEQYHLCYIDHLFQVQDESGHLQSPYYPQSNLMAFELLVKVLIASSAVACYAYQPHLLAACALLLQIIYLLINRPFCSYQRSELLFYLIAFTAHAYALATFFLPTLFNYFAAFLALSFCLLIASLIVTAVLGWRKTKQGEMLRKTFELEERSNKVAQLDESEDELARSNQITVTSHHTEPQPAEQPQQVAPLVPENAPRQEPSERQPSIAQLRQPTQRQLSQAPLRQPTQQLSQAPLAQPSVAPSRQASRRTANLTNRLSIPRQSTKQPQNPNIFEPLN